MHRQQMQALASAARAPCLSPFTHSTLAGSNSGRVARAWIKSAHKLPAYHPRSRTFALRVLQLSARASRRPSQPASMHKALPGAWRVMPWCPASADR